MNIRKTTHTPRKILMTGGAGFIGSNLLRYLLETDASLEIVNLDQLTYAGNPHIIAQLEACYPNRCRHVQGDIADLGLVEGMFNHEQFDTVIHLAAESHVDRSIEAPLKFVQTNVMGTAVLLHAAHKYWGARTDVRFHHVSTDEVYGSLGPSGLFTEETPYDPSSPYSASKASSDHLVRAWARTYGLPVTISNCSNNYGPYQFPEKFIPLLITNALAGRPLPIYGNGSNVRDWLYVEDHCRAIDTILRYAQSGTTYNAGGHNEWTNIDIANLVCDVLMELKPLSQGHYREQITFVKDRPGHDQRYAIDATKMQQKLDWTPREDFNSGLRKTIQWYIDHPQWIAQIHTTIYQGQRLGLELDRAR